MRIALQEVTDTKEWGMEDVLHSNLTYENFLDLVKLKKWDKIREIVDNLKATVSSHDFHHNLNPLAIFSDLSKEIGRKALGLVKEYEQEIWTMHKDSVFTEGIYYTDRNDSGEEFEIKPSTLQDNRTLVPVNREGSFADVLQQIKKKISYNECEILKDLQDLEIENSETGGHGTLAPTTMIEMNPGNRAKPKRLDRGPKRDKPNNVEWLDKLDVPGDYSMEQLYSGWPIWDSNR